ncbi:hypothetical protein JOD31_001699 [Methylopila capsulata]|uniref:Uncharacterized protein n=1 Tax=Methylopila capsulata TaxID=61654 RepID=A0A9W6IRZ1_9HYPH|nr:hypothetical protein [Methylopila capsulata]GLK54532.1 hypothetical protein GCM10008170_05510 [Methylopila capsulata]
MREREKLERHSRSASLSHARARLRPEAKARTPASSRDVATEILWAAEAQLKAQNAEDAEWVRRTARVPRAEGGVLWVVVALAMAAAGASALSAWVLGALP